MSLLSLLNKIVSFQRPVAGVDATGGTTRTWTVINAAMVCGIQPETARVKQDYAQLNLTVTHAVYLAADISAKLGDRIVDGSDIYLVQDYKRFSNPLGGQNVFVAHANLQVI